jgi:hypothetical protein
MTMLGAMGPEVGSAGRVVTMEGGRSDQGVWLGIMQCWPGARLPSAVDAA